MKNDTIIEIGNRKFRIVQAFSSELTVALAATVSKEFKRAETATRQKRFMLWIHEFDFVFNRGGTVVDVDKLAIYVKGNEFNNITTPLAVPIFVETTTNMGCSALFYRVFSDNTERTNFSKDVSDRNILIDSDESLMLYAESSTATGTFYAYANGLILEEVGSVEKVLNDGERVIA